MRIVFLSHTAPTGVFRVGSHHLARECALLGHDVLHVATPLNPGHALRARDPDVRRRIGLAARPRRDGDGVLQSVAVAPAPIGWHGPRYGGLLGALATMGIRAITQSSGFSAPDLVFVDQPAFVGMLHALTPRRVIYRPTEIHPESPLLEAERAMLGRAAAVVATSDVVLESLGDLGGRPSLVLENGVEVARFAQADGGDRTGVVYVGAIDARFDWDAVRAIAEANPGAPVRLAGPVTGRPPAMPSNVDVLGGVPYGEVPELLAGARVGVLPLTAVPMNRSRSPMKYYEYLAARLWVVATATPTLEQRTAPGVTLVRDPRDGGEAVRAFLAEPGTNDAGAEVARDYDWAGRARRLLAFAESV